MSRYTRARIGLAQFQTRQASSGGVLPADVAAAAASLDADARAARLAISAGNDNITARNMNALEDSLEVIEDFLAKQDRDSARRREIFCSDFAPKAQADLKKMCRPVSLPPGNSATQVKPLRSRPGSRDFRTPFFPMLHTYSSPVQGRIVDVLPTDDCEMRRNLRSRLELPRGGVEVS
jgi:hypothetical protein